MLAGGEDGERPAGSASTKEAPSVGSRTATGGTETATRTTGKPAKRDARGIEQAVTTFVGAFEESDSSRACAQVMGGAGKQLPDCAQAVGIDLRTLPSSDELDISDVSASGGSGRARLSNGSSFSLRNSSGKWLISAYRAGAR